MNHPISRLGCALAAFAFFAACTTSTGEARTLTDADILAYANSGFDKAAMMGKTETVGRHNGVRVVADHPCSDVCPQYTVRIVHYAVEPGPACDKAGGLVRNRAVPIAIAVQMKPFCVPKVLAGEH